MMIVRAKRRHNYTIISNVGMNDERLSFKARGVLAYLLTKPDDWKVSDRHLATVGPDGRSAVQAALKELENAGYLRRTKHQDESGQWVWQSVVYDEPWPDYPSTDNPPIVAEKPWPDYPATEKPATENQATIVSTEVVTTDIPTTEGTKRGAASQRTPPSPAVVVFREVHQKYPRKAQYPSLDRIDDLDLWRRVCTAWSNHGYNSFNIAGQLEWYDDPARIAQRNGNAQRVPAIKSDRTTQAFANVEKMIGGQNER